MAYKGLRRLNLFESLRMNDILIAWMPRVQVVVPTKVGAGGVAHDSGLIGTPEKGHL